MGGASAPLTVPVPRVRSVSGGAGDLPPALPFRPCGAGWSARTASPSGLGPLPGNLRRGSGPACGGGCPRRWPLGLLRLRARLRCHAPPARALGSGACGPLPPGAASPATCCGVGGPVAFGLCLVTGGPFERSARSGGQQAADLRRLAAAAPASTGAHKCAPTGTNLNKITVLCRFLFKINKNLHKTSLYFVQVCPNDGPPRSRFGASPSSAPAPFGALFGSSPFTPSD